MNLEDEAIDVNDGLMLTGIWSTPHETPEQLADAIKRTFHAGRLAGSREAGVMIQKAIDELTHS